MSQLRIQLTKEEQEEFNQMSEQQKKDFLTAANKRREHLMLKTMVLSSILVDSVEELEYFGLSRHRLKQVGRMYNKELEKIIDNVFDNIDGDDKQDSTGYVVKISQEIDKLI